MRRRPPGCAQKRRLLLETARSLEQRQSLYWRVEEIG